MSGVPASNFHGMSLNSDRRRWTSRIISPPREERRHGLEQRPAAPQRARPGRRQHLVAAEGVEVAPDRRDVDRHVGHGLGAVDQHQRARLVGPARHVLDRVDRAQRVRHVGERDQLRLELEQDVEHVLAQDPVVGDRDELEVGVLLLREQLPRDEVRVVLHLGQDDHVAPADVLAAPRVGDEVDRLGGVAREHDLVRVGDPDQPGRLRTRLLVFGRRPLADRVDPAMDVGVVFAVVGVHRLEDHLRLLRRGGGIQVHERVPVDLLVEDRELRAQALGVDRIGRARARAS